MRIKGRGFTVVELVVVITVIAILAAITTSVYNNVQLKARDTTRINDAKTIVDAVKLYRTYNGQLPKHQSADWEKSIDYPDSFINALVTSGTLPKVPVDPTNSGKFYYQYYRYGAGSNGCDSKRGPFFVLQIMRSDAQNNSTPPSPDSPGWSCPNRDNWNSSAWYTVGGYTD